MTTVLWIILGAVAVLIVLIVILSWVATKTEEQVNRGHSEWESREDDQ
jgi:uncharacterized protein YggT (Ycf19 family)